MCPEGGGGQTSLPFHSSDFFRIVYMLKNTVCYNGNHHGTQLVPTFSVLNLRKKLSTGEHQNLFINSTFCFSFWSTSVPKIPVCGSAYETFRIRPRENPRPSYNSWYAYGNNSNNNKTVCDYADQETVSEWAAWGSGVLSAGLEDRVFISWDTGLIACTLIRMYIAWPLSK